MKYSTVNEFENFEFDDVHVSDIQSFDSTFHIVLDDVKILPDNSCNRDIRKMRANSLWLKIENPKIVSFIEEGYKTYNADGVLISEDEDRTVAVLEYKEIFDCIPDGYAFSIKKTEVENGFNYEFVLDGTNEKTYTLVVQGSKDAEEWDKFLNLE